jgi:hypothetical protein
VQKNKARSNGRIKTYGPFDSLLKFCRWSSLSRSSDTKSTPRKTASGNSCKTIERNQTVGSKVMTLLTRYSSFADQRSSSPSSDSIATPRNTTYGNSCKKKKRDPKVGSKVMALLTLLLNLCRQDLLVTEKQFHNNPKENNNGNSCKNMSAIQRWYQTLWPFSPITQGWPTRPPRHRVAIP